MCRQSGMNSMRHRRLRVRGNIRFDSLFNLDLLLGSARVAPRVEEASRLQMRRLGLEYDAPSICV